MSDICGCVPSCAPSDMGAGMAMTSTSTSGLPMRLAKIVEQMMINKLKRPIKKRQMNMKANRRLVQINRKD